MRVAAPRSAPRVFRYNVLGGVISARVVVQREMVSVCFSHPGLHSHKMIQCCLELDKARNLSNDTSGSMLSFGMRGLVRRASPEWIDLKAVATKSKKTVPALIASELHDDFPIRVLTPGRVIGGMQECWVMVFADPRCTSFDSNVPIEGIDGPLMSAKLLNLLSAPNSEREIFIS